MFNLKEMRLFWRLFGTLLVPKLFDPFLILRFGLQTKAQTSFDSFSWDNFWRTGGLFSKVKNLYDKFHNMFCICNTYLKLWWNQTVNDYVNGGIHDHTHSGKKIQFKKFFCWNVPKPIFNAVDNWISFKSFHSCCDETWSIQEWKSDYNCQCHVSCSDLF